MRAIKRIIGKLNGSPATDPQAFDEWEVRTVVDAHGQESVLYGSVHSTLLSHQDTRRYVEAINQGLLDAGFESEVTFIRNVTV